MPVLTFCLGTWQVKRLGWKLDMIASLEDKLSREPARLPDHIDTQAIPEFAYRKVIVQGTFDHEHEIALGPRTRDGKLGVHVITPLKRADGQDTVLVNRGFVTRDKQAQHTRPESLVQGPVSVTGLLRSQEPRNAFTPDNAPEKGSWVFMDIAQVAQHTGAEPVLIDEVYHGNAGQMMQRIANGEPVGREATIELRNQHLTYAITWSVRHLRCWFTLPLTLTLHLARAGTHSLLRRRSCSSASRDALQLPLCTSFDMCGSALLFLYSPCPPVTTHHSSENEHMATAEHDTLVAELLRLAPPPSTRARARAGVSIIVNPHAGARQAGTLVQHVVQRVLRAHDIAVKSLLETRETGDGKARAHEVVAQTGHDSNDGDAEAVLVAGGDGTLGEVIDGLASSSGIDTGHRRWQLVILPFGTANARFFHHFPPERSSSSSAAATAGSSSTDAEQRFRPFASLLAFLLSNDGSSKQTSSAPVSIARNTLHTSASATSTTMMTTHVVSSAALHAALLMDADELRDEIPSLDRFKVAAARNLGKLWHGKLVLHPRPSCSSANGDSARVQRYSPRTKRLEDVPVSDATTGQEEGASIELEGPFAYLVGALVSRFEPTFVVAPLLSSPHVPSPSSHVDDDERPPLDVVVIRPRRDSSLWTVSSSSGELTLDSEALAKRTIEISGQMYNQGEHINLTLPSPLDPANATATAIATGEESEPVVEYMRCGSFSWYPSPAPATEREDGSSKWDVVCLDGWTTRLGQDGAMHVEALPRATCAIDVFC